MIDKIIKDLGDNFNEDDYQVLNELIDIYGTIASNNSNRSADDKKLYPYIFNAVKSAYIRRGDDGKTSSSVGSISESYEDIEAKLKRDVINVRVMI